MNLINLQFGKYRTSNKKLKKYISILPKEYKSCDIPIILVNRNIIGFILLNLLLCFYFSKVTFKYFSNSGGAYNRINNRRFIYIISNCEEVLIFSLFHKLRHWYQEMYLNEFFENCLNIYNPDTSIDNYSKQRIEIDANNFSKKYCKKLGFSFKKNKNKLIIYKRN